MYYLGNIDDVERLIVVEGECFISTKINKLSLLHQAAILNYNLTVEYFLRFDTGQRLLFKQDSYGDTPLHLAIRNYSKDVINVILENMIDRKILLVTNKLGFTPLNSLISFDYDHGIIYKILSYTEGQDSLLISNKIGNTPLHNAVIWEKQNIIDLISTYHQGQQTLYNKNKFGMTPKSLCSIHPRCKLF